MSKELRTNMSIIDFAEFRDTIEEIHGKKYKISIDSQDNTMSHVGILKSVQTAKRLFENNDPNQILLPKIAFITEDNRRIKFDNVIYWGFSDIIRDKQGILMRANINITSRVSVNDDDTITCNFYKLKIYK